MKHSVKFFVCVCLIALGILNVNGLVPQKKRQAAYNYKSINPAVVLISSGVGYGMGVVIAKDIVLTSEHVVYEPDRKPEIKINFFPDFREAEGQLLKFSSKNGSYQLALIAADTGDVKPMIFA